MVSKQDLFLLDFFTQFYYLSDKRIIEEQFDGVESPKILKQREKLLKAASKNAKIQAKKTLKEFKSQNKDFTSANYSSMEEFAKKIQKDILDS